MVTALYLYSRFLSSVTTESTYYKSAFTHSHAHKYTSGRGVPCGDTCSVGTHSCTSEAAMFGSVSCGLNAGVLDQNKNLFIPSFVHAPFVWPRATNGKYCSKSGYRFFEIFFFFYVGRQTSIPAKTKWWPQREDKNERSCRFRWWWWLAERSVWVALFTFQSC